MFFVNKAAPLHWKLFVLDLPWGELKILFSNEGIGRVILPGCALALQEEAYALEKPPWPGLEAELKNYFQGHEIKGKYPLLACGYAAWTLKILQLTVAIPFGKTCSYGEIAGTAGKPQGARAVGQVMARNNTPILVPCHRVVGHNGGLGGFSSGLEWKQRLLNLESAERRDNDGR